MNINNKGVYKITNIKNGKVYIGSTSASFNSRWKAHISDLKRGTHSSKHLLNSYRKYGIESFKFEIIEEFENIGYREVLKIEQYYLDKIKPYRGNVGYNMSSIASSGKCPLLCDSVVGFDIFGNKVFEFESGEEAYRNGFSMARRIATKNDKLKIPKHKNNNVYILFKDKVGNSTSIDVPKIDRIFKVDGISGEIIISYDKYEDVEVLKNTKKYLSDKLKNMSITKEDGTYFCRESRYDELISKINNFKIVAVFNENGELNGKYLSNHDCALKTNKTISQVKNLSTHNNNIGNHKKLKSVNGIFIKHFINKETPNKLKI